MSKLVQKVEWEIPDSPKTEIYMYGEADVEHNMAMQEVLEKLYRYEKAEDKFLELICEVERYYAPNPAASKMSVHDLLNVIYGICDILGYDKENRLELEEI